MTISQMLLTVGQPEPLSSPHFLLLPYLIISFTTLELQAKRKENETQLRVGLCFTLLMFYSWSASFPRLGGGSDGEKRSPGRATPLCRQSLPCSPLRANDAVLLLAAADASI